MLRCEHCGIDLPDNPSHCPLCGSVPVGENDGGTSRFPKLYSHEASFIRKLTHKIAFASVCAVLICISINLMLPSGGWWSLFVVAGMVTFWVDFIIWAKRYRNSVKIILWQAVTLSVIAFVWDIATGRNGWSVDFVFPILSACSVAAILLSSKIRGLHIQDYILYLVLGCILGVIPLIVTLMLSRVMIIPSVLCFLVSAISAASLLFFHGRALWFELQRRMHF